MYPFYKPSKQDISNRNGIPKSLIQAGNAVLFIGIYFILKTGIYEKRFLYDTSAYNPTR